MLALLLACAPAAPPTSAAEPALPAPTAPIAAPDPAPTPILPPPGKADGESCVAATECSSGFCEGEGCDAEHAGVCVGSMRSCTRDLRPYCGCDGGTFLASGTCPNRRFANRGPCAP